MSEEPLERSRKTIDDARHAADEAREAEPFHRGAVEDTQPDEADTEAAGRDGEAP